MEIKTCEDYVVTRVMQLEDKCVEYENTIANLNVAYDLLRKKLEVVEEIKKLLNITIRLASDKTEHYITVGDDYIWETCDKKVYTRLCEIFNLKYEEESDEE